MNKKNNESNIWKVLRTIKLRFTLTENERKAIKNSFSYLDLSNRKMNYDLSDVKFGAKKVVYTCITGGYDNLIQQTFYNHDWDYICFTDDENLLKLKQKGCWKIEPLRFNSLNNSLNNRWHKTHPHILFPQYEESIYIDGNIDIISNFIFEQIEKKRDCNIVLPKHFKNDCIYDEIRYVSKLNKARKDELKSMKEILDKNNFPKHYGLSENNIIFRKNHDKDVIEIMEEWWMFIKDVIPRDQLSLAFVLWKHGKNINNLLINNARLEINNFHFYASNMHK